MKTSFQPLIQLFISSFTRSPLQDAKMELAAAERELLHAESVCEDYNARVPVYRKRIARLRAYVREYEAHNGVKLDKGPTTAALSGVDWPRTERRSERRDIPLPEIK